ncbi:site-2 protease family protein [Tepidibacillus fermentans]|uniref:site-2 protease family protein n=1 Tax=Tepidibacillus fermentans TaxID=1281767 RepID=UPI00104D0B70|nr:site-2 protease family protein [Tepidibacillus fermentans]
MQQFLYYPISELPYVIVALIIAFTVHEFSHAYVAYRLGDPTAKNEGRLTLNPAAHLDLFGTLMIFIAGFGWAKPVPVNHFHFRHRRLSGALVSFAGPLSNLMIAIIFIGLYFTLYRIGLLSNLSESTYSTINQLVNMVVSLNVVLFVFNLLPFPPLDGYRIIEDLAPNDVRVRLIQYEQYGVFLFLILFITPLGDYVFAAIFDRTVPYILNSLVALFQWLFGY